MKRNPKDPLAALNDIRDRINELLEDSVRHISTQTNNLNSDAGAMEAPVDMLEDGDNLLIVLEMPGVSKKDVDIQLIGNDLLVKAEKKHDPVKSVTVYHMAERIYGPFQRRIRLPESVKENAIKTTLQNGLLEIRIKKTEPLQIPVK